MYLDLLDVHLRFTSPWPPSWFAFFFLPARSESADGCHKRPEEWGDGTRKKKLNCREFNIQAQQERNILVSPSSPSPSLFKKKQNKSKIRRQPLRAVTVKTWKRKKTAASTDNRSHEGGNKKKNFFSPFSSLLVSFLEFGFVWLVKSYRRKRKYSICQLLKRAARKTGSSLHLIRSDSNQDEPDTTGSKAHSAARWHPDNLREQSHATATRESPQSLSRSANLIQTFQRFPTASSLEHVILLLPFSSLSKTCRLHPTIQNASNNGDSTRQNSSVSSRLWWTLL